MKVFCPRPTPRGSPHLLSEESFHRLGRGRVSARHVGSLVLQKGGFPTEAFPTLGAVVGPLARVDSLVLN